MHDLKYIDAANNSATNPESGDSSKRTTRRDENDDGKILANRIF